MGKVLSVVSGKGGTGKTTFTANTAVALSLCSKKVAIIDCDFKMRNLDQHLGLADAGVFDFYDVLCGNAKLSDSFLKTDRFPNLSFIPASNSFSFTEGDCLKNFPRIARELREQFDYIFFDCPSGADTPVSEIAQESDEILIVVLPDKTSIRNAERILWRLSDLGTADFSLVVNRVDVSLMKEKVCPNVDNIMDTLSIPLLGIVYEEPGAPRYLAKGIPMSAENFTLASVCFQNIARRILGERVPICLI